MINDNYSILSYDTQTKMVTEQSWSSFHQKYGSQSSRRNLKYDHDDDNDLDRRIFSDSVQSLLKKCSSSGKLIVSLIVPPEESLRCSRPPLSRSSSPNRPPLSRPSSAYSIGRKQK